ncbi:hypothetical protein [Adlercreutzia sp. ZJ242]|uniref:hypothetical protein n=1 Tax=Adlercreutzia sp. ZJ242 TaxID=2709409 RepID=UPI00198135A2|nr:hypothetical protein [Adlercreutzia sp. ZJ242]
MRYRIQLEKSFAKRYAKLTAAERGMVDDKLRILAENPWHPSLRTKRIQGTGEYEVSVNMDIRMALTFEVMAAPFFASVIRQHGVRIYVRQDMRGALYYL